MHLRDVALPRRAVSSLWRAVGVPVDRFHWLLGARVALAFAGPLVVAHLAGWGPADAAVIAFAGLIVALVGGNLPAGRVRRTQGPLLVVVIPLVSAIYLAVPAHHPIGVAVMAVGCLVAGLVPLRRPALGAVATTFAMALIMVPRLPRDSHTTVLLLAGGLIASGIVVATDRLCHPRLALPALPTPRREPATPDELRRHAIRLGLTIGLAATIALVVGDGSTLTARSSWMLLGAFIALQPQLVGTRYLAVQRAVGTAVGAAMTIPLAVAMPSVVWVGWILLVLAFVSFGLRTVNDAWYCVVLTPVVVLGFGGDPLDTRVLAARVLWTTAGVLLALVAHHLLWSREPDVDAEVAPTPIWA